MRILLCLVLCTVLSGLQAQNLEFRSTTTYPSDMSDVWGYTDGEREYALATYEDGWSVVDVTDPDNPEKLFDIPGVNTYWRDIKTYGNYAYGIHEDEGLGNEGLIIMDLSQLPDALPISYWSTDGTPGLNYRAAHNIFIDENGVAYITGHNMSSGGVLMLDVAANPVNPHYLGQYTDRYVHDCFARNDTLWTAEVGAGQFSVIDVRNKSNPIVLARQTTPLSFTHNIWVSDDGKTAFTTDERTGAFLAAYDVTDMDDITEIDRYRSGSNVIPHNAHVKDEFVVVSWYSHGVIVLDATFPDELVEVGRYDTAPNYPGPGFHGAWGVYPYLPSGNILVTDIEEGLVVLTPDYHNAAHIRGQVVHAETEAPIGGATVRISGPDGTNGQMTTLEGLFKKGMAFGGSFNIEVSRTGFETANQSVTLEEGDIAEIVIELQPVIYIPADTVEVELLEGETVSICAFEADGFTPDLAFSCGDAQSSIVGEWSVSLNENTGCLEYSAFEGTGGSTDEVCVVLLEEAGGTYSATVVVVSIASAPTGIAENGFENGSLQLLGNPVTDDVHIRFRGNPAQPATFRIYDCRGSLVASAAVHAGEGDVRLPAARLSAGIYLISVHTDNELIGTTKFLKK